MAHDTSPAWVAENYRLYDDDAAVGSATPLAAENTAANVTVGANFRLRVRVGETANATISNTGSWVLQFSVNGGAFTTVGSATSVRYVDSTHVTDGSTGFTGVLTAIGAAATYQSSWNEVDENNAVTSQTWTDDECEYEYSLNLNGPSAGDAVTFRMLSPSTSTATTFTNVPTVNVQAAPVEGTLSVTLGTLTVSGSGSVTTSVEGTASVTFGAVSVSGSGDVDVAGTASVTLGAATAAGSGEVDIDGSAAIELGYYEYEYSHRWTLLPRVTRPGGFNEGRMYVPWYQILPLAQQPRIGLTLSGSGSVASVGSATGTASITLGALTVAGTGEVDVGGTLSVSLGALTAAGTAEIDVAGTFAVALSALTAAGAGDVDVSGTASLTFGSLTASGAGDVDVDGTFSVSLSALTVAGSGTSQSFATGTAAIALGAASLAGTGEVDVVGTASLTLGAATVSATGEVDIEATGSATLGALTVAGVGEVDVGGAFAVSLAAVTLSAAGSGQPLALGTASITLAAVTASGSGDVLVEGTSASALGAASLSASGAVDIGGTSSVSLGALVVSGTGESVDNSISGAASIALSPVSASGAGEVDIEGAGSITLGSLRTWYPPIPDTGSATTPFDDRPQIQLAVAALAGRERPDTMHARVIVLSDEAEDEFIFFGVIDGNETAAA